MHLVVGVEGDQFHLDIEVVAGLDGSCMGCLAEHQIGLDHSALPHSKLSVCKHGHDDGLSSSRVASPAVLSFLVPQPDEVSSHRNDLCLHLFHQGECIAVKGVGVGKLLGEIGDELGVLFECIS